MFNKASLNISLINKAISTRSMVEEDAKEESDCEEHLKRSTCKGLFLALQLDCCLI